METAARSVEQKSSPVAHQQVREFLVIQFEAALNGTPFLFQFDVDGTAAGYTLSADDTRFSTRMVKTIRALQALPNVFVEINTSSPPERNIKIQRASRVAIPGHTVKGDVYLDYVQGKPQLSESPNNTHLLPFYEKIRAELDRQLSEQFGHNGVVVVDDPNFAVRNGLIYFDFKGPETSFQAKGSPELTRCTEEIVQAVFEGAAKEWLEESRHIPERTEVVGLFKGVKLVQNVGNIEVAVELENGWDKAKAFTSSLERLGTTNGIFWGDDTGDMSAFEKITALTVSNCEVLGVAVRNETEYYEDGSVKFAATDPRILQAASAVVETHAGMAELTISAVENFLSQNQSEPRLSIAKRIINAPDRNFGPINRSSTLPQP